MRDTKSGRRLLPFLPFVLAIVPGLVQAQQDELAFESLPLDQGASTHVSCILQDRTGLYRYDGYSFVSYKNIAGNSTSLADNRRSTLYEDKAGVRWGKLTLDPDAPESGDGVWEITWNGTTTLGASGFVSPMKWVGQGKGGAIDGMQLTLAERRSTLSL